MKSVGIREFRDHASAYMGTAEALAIERHGRVIGFFVPVRRSRAAARQALERLGASLEQALADAGISEDELEGIIASADIPAGNETRR